MKALVGAFNQEKALVGAFSVIVKTDCETDGSFYSTTADPTHGAAEPAGDRAQVSASDEPTQKLHSPFPLLTRPDNGRLSDSGDGSEASF